MRHFILRSSMLAMAALLLLGGCSSKRKHRPSVQTNSTIVHKALIVASGDYAGSGHDLVGIDLDREKMRQRFASWGFDVEVLTDPLQFEQRLGALAQTLRPEDVFVLYYSGHGSHTPDTSHDEADGQDEQIVLSDGNTDRFLLDDRINLLLNPIAARKLIIFDSCFSGTATKRAIRGAEHYQTKYMPAPKSAEDDSPQNADVPNTPMQGTYLYFAACRDDEQSLASSNGSLFTNALAESMQLNSSAEAIRQRVLNRLEVYFHPQLSESQPLLKSMPLRSYLKL